MDEDGATLPTLMDTVTKVVTVLTDSPTSVASSKHKPVEAEASLASLLLGKEPFSLANILPGRVDPDFDYFENVLLADPKV